MKLFEINDTEFIVSKISYGVVLMMKRGQMSITAPVNPDQLLFIIEGLKKEYDLIMAHRASRFDGVERKELRNIARNVRDKHKDD